MAKAKWTVMVLMGADNVENEADLTGCAADDIGKCALSVQSKGS